MRDYLVYQFFLIGLISGRRKEGCDEEKVAIILIETEIDRGCQSVWPVRKTAVVARIIVRGFSNLYEYIRRFLCGLFYGQVSYLGVMIDSSRAHDDVASLCSMNAMVVYNCVNIASMHIVQKNCNFLYQQRVIAGIFLDAIAPETAPASSAEPAEYRRESEDLACKRCGIIP